MPEMLIYNGKDISEYTTPVRAVHEMFSGGRGDTLELTFEDPDHLWPRWRPKIGDEVTYQNEGSSTGKMYVYDFDFEGNAAHISVCSIPPKFRDIYSKTWEEVYLSQMLSEVTDSYQLNGIEDFWYRHKACSTSLASFINTIAELEGAVLIFYEGKVLLVNEQYLEAQKAQISVDCRGADVKIKDSTASLFDGCILKSGSYSGNFFISEGERVYIPSKDIPCSSDAEAYRYARSLLRAANRDKTDIRWEGALIPQLSAGICVDLVNEDAPLWSGRMYVYRVRHDYQKRATTIYMRKPLEGY